MLEVIDHPTEAPAGSIRELRLARPPVNALNTELLRAFAAALEGASKTSAIVITGQPGMFSAGLDVRGLLELDRAGAVALFIELLRAQRAVAFAPVPVIFGITGHCPAGGTVLALNGDYRVMASGDFKLGLNEVQVGLFPGPVIYGTFRRLVGGHAAQLATRGALIDPVAALRIGLVDELCDAAQVPARALEVAREFCALPREVMLKTRADARADLHALYGNPSHALLQDRDFAAKATDAWFAPATQERLRKMFAKK
jgi:Delta3-Delta2-enoyl-CoA isomerase